MAQARPRRSIDKRLMPILVATRRALEKKFPRNHNCRNLCSFSVCVVEILASERGIPVEIIGGEYRSVVPIEKPIFGNAEHITASRTPIIREGHAWIRHRKQYIDLTLTQFEESAPAIAILPESDKRYCGKPEDPWLIRVNLDICGYSEEQLEAVVKLAKEIAAIEEVA